jgi:hypothetical protein
MKKNYVVSCFINSGKTWSGNPTLTNVELNNPAETKGFLVKQLFKAIPNCATIVNFWEE